MEMRPSTARRFWTALMNNAVGLIVDAHTLLTHRSYGRARSLTVLAQEELGKALWLYQTFANAWSTGDTTSRTVERIRTDGRRTAAKCTEALLFGQKLPEFWGRHEECGWPEDNSAEAWTEFFAEQRDAAFVAGEQSRVDKIAGFYVDLVSTVGMVHSPDDVHAGTIAEDLEKAAQVIDMLLIQDNSRRQDAEAMPPDESPVRPGRLFPIAYPDAVYLRSSRSDEQDAGNTRGRPRADDP